MFQTISCKHHWLFDQSTEVTSYQERTHHTLPTATYGCHKISTPRSIKQAKGKDKGKHSSWCCHSHFFQRNRIGNGNSVVMAYSIGFTGVNCFVSLLWVMVFFFQAQGSQWHPTVSIFYFSKTWKRMLKNGDLGHHLGCVFTDLSMLLEYYSCWMHSVSR